MNKEILISVIIPVYNVEQYLRQCVDSVLRQTYSSFEVILVDDGSPDSCPFICDEYALQHNRIHVIHKSNGGLSDARNAGLKTSQGEYVIFLDGDDYWTSQDALQELIEIILKYKFVDIIYFRSFSFWDHSKKEISCDPEFDLGRINGKEKDLALEYLIVNDRFISSACNKLVRRQLIERIQFKKGLLSEDIDWNFAITLCAEHLYATNSLIYAYRRRIGSVTQTVGHRNIVDLLSIIEKWAKYLLENNPDEKQNNLLLSYCTYQLSICLALISVKIDKSQKKDLIKKVKELKFLWKYDQMNKVKKVKRMYKLLGTKLTSKALGSYLKYR